MPSSLADAKKLRVTSQIEEMQALDNAGMRQNGRYLELSYQVNEFEEEEEQRNYTNLAKITEPTNITHHRYSCIGPQTCLKQRNLRKVFPYTLA